MRLHLHLAGLALSILASGVAAQVSSYDLATGVLTLPSVKVGNATYTGVTLKNIGNFTFTLQNAAEQIPPGPGTVTYDGATGVVMIPAVKVGNTTYTNVSLLNVGNFTFTLQAATEVSAATQSELNAYFAAVDALFALAVPTSGADRFAYRDNCYLGVGRTKAYVVSEYDTKLKDWRTREAYRVGQVTTNVQVLAERNLKNGDGSTRREIDVQYDQSFTDGTTAIAETATLISGSSAGSPGCANPQNSSNWRSYGDRQVVEILVRSRIQRDERYSISTGAPFSTLVSYRREVQFIVDDPLGNATYVVMTGPGPSATVNGVATQFGMKLISPWLMRSAPEFAGKNQNFLNWLDDDNFGTCRATGAVPVPSVADCAGLGAQSANWGWTTSTPNAAADQGFQDQGWVAGGWYRFDVYNDDGWKTINGQAGRTPIGTYYAQLEQLPYTFVEIAGTGINADKFPRLTVAGLTSVQLLANIKSATPTPVNLSWTDVAGFSDGRKFEMFRVFEYFEGPKVGNAAGVLYPGYQSVVFNYPGSKATWVAGFQVSPKLSDMASKTYANFTVEYRDRNTNIIRSRLTFQ